MPADPAPPALAAELTRLIREHGPIDLARFMELAQDHPEHGYYRQREPFGRAGDFVTAPETSQMFGEVLGLFLAQAWLDQGRPFPVRLIELGPGRGTLIADFFRVAQAVPGFPEALQVHLVERSPRLAALQRERLGARVAAWHERIEEVPDGPALVVANEFLDALPVHQLVRTPDGPAQRGVGLDALGRLAFVEGIPPGDLTVAAEMPGWERGTIHEVSPARVGLVRTLARRIRDQGGLALLIDYGAVADGPTGDTLQAVRGHAAVHPLDAPGTADLSTQVDFGPLVAAAAGEGAAVYGPVFQGTFLRTLGIELRAARLLEAARGGSGRDIRSALFRLTDPSAMGEVFKVLVIGAPDAPPPPGFAHDA